MRPLGFRLDDRQLRRAGLDYWEHVELTVHENWAAFLSATEGRRRYFFSKKSRRIYSEVQFQPGDFLIFGSETDGLPSAILQEHAESTLRIPLLEPQVRSLNLADSAAIALYEALRQNNFFAQTEDGP